MNVMTQLEILEELKSLTNVERLAIIEAALSLIRQDLYLSEQPSAGQERKQQLAEAARTLLPDYTAGGDLTSFTAIR